MSLGVRKRMLRLLSELSALFTDLSYTPILPYPHTLYELSAVSSQL